MGVPDHVDEASESAPARSGTKSIPFAAGHIVAKRYRLIRELGEGGMGVVWVAHSLVLGVDVAIKLIRSGVADSELASRMAREAQATATLGHPAIVRVFDFGNTERGDPFLVMELAHGETLAALLRREQRIPPVQALQLILPIVDGLRCAHERGIIHRDIKPENVFIARDTLGRLQPKLLDFGIAKLEHQPAVNRLTQVGEVLGSPEFMSPEQARGVGSVDLRTDVWALCVVIYEMLTGTVPFRVTNYNALMQAILHEQPLPTFEYGVGDRELWAILAKGLEKQREKRWASMTELGEALAFWLFDHGVSEDVVGNSLKAVWLGGTLSGLSREESVDTTKAALSAAMNRPTLRLHFRRFRSRLTRALTPPVVAGLAAVVLTAAGLLALRSAADGSSVASAPPPLSAVAPPAPSSERLPPPLPVATQPVASAAPSASAAAAVETPPVNSVKHASRSAPRPAPVSRPAPARRSVPTKSIRDFGF